MARQRRVLAVSQATCLSAKRQKKIEAIQGAEAFVIRNESHWHGRCFRTIGTGGAGRVAGSAAAFP